MGTHQLHGELNDIITGFTCECNQNSEDVNIDIDEYSVGWEMRLKSGLMSG